MVLFLFVIMLLGAERLPQGEALRWQPLVAIPLALILAGDFAYQFVSMGGRQPDRCATRRQILASRRRLASCYFPNIMLPFEVTGVILLVAVVGAIMLAKPDRPSSRTIPGQAGRRVVPPLTTSQEQSSMQTGVSKETVGSNETEPEQEQILPK